MRSDKINYYYIYSVQQSSPQEILINVHAASLLRVMKTLLIPALYKNLDLDIPNYSTVCSM